MVACDMTFMNNMFLSHVLYTQQIGKNILQVLH